MFRSNWSAPLVAACIALSACESGSGTRPGPLEGPSIKSVTPSTTNVSVSLTNYGSIPITVERGGSYDGQINLSISGLPNGVVGVFTPAVLGTFNATSVLALTVFPTAVAGTSTATVRASGTGVSDKTVPISITVTIPSVSLSLGSSSATVAREGSVTVPVTIARGGGFADVVTLSAVNLPTGVTASFAPPALGVGATTSVLTLSASISAPLGSSAISVRTSALDVAAQTVPLNLTIADATAPTYQLSPGTQSVTVVRGSSGQNTINITRAGGITVPVSLSVLNLPEGVTATFTPGSTTGASSVVRLDVSSTAPVGNRTLTVVGTAAGITDRSTGFTLTVQPIGILVSAPQAITVARGATAGGILSVSRQTGVDETITVTVSGLTAGLTTSSPLSFPSTSATTVSAAISINAATTVAPGTYTLTFRGTTPSGLTSTSTTTVTVTQ
jgi:hypothetical protein